MVGVFVMVGVIVGISAMAPVTVEYPVAMPSLFSPVTTERMYMPTSLASSVYVSVNAPAMARQVVVSVGDVHRSQLYESVGLSQPPMVTSLVNTAFRIAVPDGAVVAVTVGATGATSALHCAPKPSIQRFDCVPYPVINDVVTTADGWVVMLGASQMDVLDVPDPNTVPTGRSNSIGVPLYAM
jgi:hypothetical protein